MYHLNFSCNVTVGKVRPKRGGAWPDRPIANARNFHRCRVSLLSGGERHGRQHSELRRRRDRRRTERMDSDTKTGKGDPKWTIEPDKTAPSNSKVVKQSGRATYPLLLKDDTDIKDGFIQIKFKTLPAPRIARAASSGGPEMRTTTMWPVPMRSRTTSWSTRPSQACAAHLTSSAGREATESSTAAAASSR